MLRKFTMFSLMVFLAHACLLAQDKPTETAPVKEEKKKEIDERVIELLDQAIAGGESLNLSRNRAIVYGIAGDLYWRYDEKRARELFKKCAAEIVTYNLELERQRRENPSLFADIWDFSSGEIRTDLLPLVAKHDPELALEMLLQTRPDKITQAILRSSLPGAKSSSGFDPDRQRVNGELALEQRFALLAADANAERAIKLIKDSLAKGISPNVIQLLQKLNKKDSKKAADLGGDVVRKLIDSDLAKNDDDMRSAIGFLQFAFKPPKTDGKDKPFAFTDDQIKGLARRVASAFLETTKSIAAASRLDQAMPMLEKFIPERMAPLRQRQSENEMSMPNEYKDERQQRLIWDKNSTAEDIIGIIPKLKTEYEKASAYSAFANKISDIDDDTRAKKLIDQIPDEKARTNATEQYEAMRIERTAKAGKLDDARKLIGNLTKKSQQIHRLVALAVEFYKTGGEKNIAAAKALMKDAHGLTSDAPETNEEIGDLMELVKGYATIDPDVGFKTFDSVIDKFNEYIQASAVFAKFEPKYSTFKKGELELKVRGERWEIPVFRYFLQMQMLAKADIGKMNLLADKFDRNEVKTIVKLYALQGFLKDDKEQEPTDDRYYLEFW